MEAPEQSAPHDSCPETTALWAWASIGAAALVVIASIGVPRLLGIDVRVHWPPLHADIRDHLPPYLIGVAALGIGLAVGAPGFIDRLRWPMAVVATTTMSWVWTISLALSEGSDGISRVFSRQGEYRYDAQRVVDVSEMLAGFIDRIPRDTVDHWHTHVAGHPPGALLSFVLLDRFGVTSAFWVGVVVVTVGASAVAAIMLTLNEVGSEALARRAGVWIALAPAAVWAGVSADWYYTAVAAWGLFLLTRATRRGSVTAGVGAGVLLGWCIFLSYGLVLLAIPAIAVIWTGSHGRALAHALAGSLTVAAIFWASGFAWWEAFPVLRERYYAGIAADRPYGYWVWADVAAWIFTLGLATCAALPTMMRLARKRSAAAILVSSTVASVGVAAISGMSKAEVERIWLPFTAWVLAAGGLLPARWRSPLLLSQIATAVAVQALLLTRW